MTDLCTGLTGRYDPRMGLVATAEPTASMPLESTSRSSSMGGPLTSADADGCTTGRPTDIFFSRQKKKLVESHKWCQRPSFLVGCGAFLASLPRGGGGGGRVQVKSLIISAMETGILFRYSSSPPLLLLLPLLPLSPVTFPSTFFS